MVSDPEREQAATAVLVKPRTAAMVKVFILSDVGYFLVLFEEIIFVDEMGRKLRCAEGFIYLGLTLTNWSFLSSSTASKLSRLQACLSPCSSVS
jgi:hypothetical protein